VIWLIQGTSNYRKFERNHEESGGASGQSVTEWSSSWLIFVQGGPDGLWASEREKNLRFPQVAKTAQLVGCCLAVQMQSGARQAD